MVPMIKKVLLRGDKIFTKNTVIVKEIVPKTKRIIQEMTETLVYRRFVGIAANQIGYLDRIILVKMHDLTIVPMINPVIFGESVKENIDREGCGSIPWLGCINVSRPNTVVVHYLDIDGTRITKLLYGWDVRVTCHEVDHLNNIFIIDRRM